MDNISLSRKTESETEISAPSIVITETYIGADFKIGDVITLKNKPEYGNGVIFKELEDFNFWVAFPNIENRISSHPCMFNVYNRREMMLENKN